MQQALLTMGLAALAMIAAGCKGGDERELDTFVIEVHGTRATLERFQVSAPGMEIVPGLVFTDGFLSRVLRSRRPWPELVDQAFELSATDQGSSLSSVRLKPYLCAAGGQLERLSAGWRARETHQVFLTATGRLEVDMDFDHPLHYSCEWWTEDGREGEGMSTLTHAVPLCTDETRKGTLVRVTGKVGGVLVDAGLETCEAVLTDKQQGEIFLTLRAPTEAGAIVLSASHCLTGPDEAFPAELSVIQDQRCPTGAAVSVAAKDGAPRSLQLVSGRWLIRAANFSKAGRITGELDVSAGTPPDSLRIAGPVDLPLLRVPLEFDWPK
jgi:hypothetical protein